MAAEQIFRGGTVGFEIQNDPGAVLFQNAVGDALDQDFSAPFIARLGSGDGAEEPVLPEDPVGF